MTQLHSHSTGRGTVADFAAAPLPTLNVSALSVSVVSPNKTEMPVLNDVAFSIAPGEVLGVLGESGAGKSTLALALLQLLPTSFKIRSGSILLGDISLHDLGEEELRLIRGNEISLIYQDSSTLNPVLRIDRQVSEVIRAHSNWNSSRCLAEGRAMLELVGLGSDRIFSAYPHQLSGGQKQRVAIAQALACGPDLLIADEPTAFLDATTTLEVLDLIESVRSQFDTAVLLISHQPEVLAYLASRVMVLYAGQIIESGSTKDIFNSPAHPYTRELIRCGQPLANQQDRPCAKAHWPFISGASSFATDACPFENRCPDRMDICATGVPAITTIQPSHHVRCFDYAQEAL